MATNTIYEYYLHQFAQITTWPHQTDFRGKQLIPKVFLKKFYDIFTIETFCNTYCSQSKASDILQFCKNITELAHSMTYIPSDSADLTHIINEGGKIP